MPISCNGWTTRDKINCIEPPASLNHPQAFARIVGSIHTLTTLSVSLRMCFGVYFATSVYRLLLSVLFKAYYCWFLLLDKLRCSLSYVLRHPPVSVSEAEVIELVAGCEWSNKTRAQVNNYPRHFIKKTISTQGREKGWKVGFPRNTLKVAEISEVCAILIQQPNRLELRGLVYKN